MGSIARTLPYSSAFTLAPVARYLGLTSQLLNSEVVTMVRHIVKIINLSAFTHLGAKLTTLEAVFRKRLYM